MKRWDKECNGHTPAWFYRVTLRETGGVGVSIQRFQWDFYCGTRLCGTQTNSNADFARWFNDCGVGRDYIPAMGRACGDLCAYISSPSGSVVMTFYGIDDLGHSVSISGNVELR